MPLLGALPSLEKANLLVEFASLRHGCPDGVYMSITPGDPSTWTGVIFIRKAPSRPEADRVMFQGPYAPAILRVQISFPQAYPAVPPLVALSTDIFHPLVTPLTTYTYTTGSASGETVSATDEERLPPGGFSLRHGFPQWFSRTRRSTPAAPNSQPEPRGDVGPAGEANAHPPPVAKILKYIQASFTDEAILDSVTVESAANPGAYHAWRSFRETQFTGSLQPMTKSSAAPATRSRHPGEWNWEGVWEERVKKGINNSISDGVLYSAGVEGDDVECAWALFGEIGKVQGHAFVIWERAGNACLFAGLGLWTISPSKLTLSVAREHSAARQPGHRRSAAGQGQDRRSVRASMLPAAKASSIPVPTALRPAGEIKVRKRRENRSSASSVSAAQSSICPESQSSSINLTQQRGSPVQTFATQESPPWTGQPASPTLHRRKSSKSKVFSRVLGSIQTSRSNPALQPTRNGYSDGSIFRKLSMRRRPSFQSRSKSSEFPVHPSTPSLLTSSSSRTTLRTDQPAKSPQRGSFQHLSPQTADQASPRPRSAARGSPPILTVDLNVMTEHEALNLHEERCVWVAIEARGVVKADVRDARQNEGDGLDVVVVLDNS
ncbi:ubiquitin-conjugating enzyme [Botryosphaeria dothidea]|uniref:Ubiquitin-conjugating enzyme n=1 Tax=Botryosphaeria dothidea TaxID=55169 RepID=A0A8H4NA78_9PEZI|nr:ubiquitin-conjugating enzyme [Botryosphaeria dothidea]